MIIRLPKTFTYRDKNNNGSAYVLDGVLYIRGNVNFRNLMYKVTFELKGQERCQYCGKLLTPRNRTIDHMYPQSFGGPSITENLLPCCKRCNLDKRDMTYMQFQEWRKIESLSEKEKFFQKCINENQKVKRKGKFLVKKGWITKVNIKEMVEHMSFKSISSLKMRKTEEHFEEFKQYKKPIIISANGWLLEGKQNLKCAKNHKRYRICAVVLDNVIVEKNSP